MTLISRRATRAICVASAATALAWTAPRLVAADREKAASPPTYARDIAPMLRKHCASCHREGQVGPFSLDTYEQARKRAIDIADVVGAGEMPPWKPVAGVGPKLKNDRHLKAEDIATITAWAEAGAPRGEAEVVEAAPDPVTPEGCEWSLGTPDLVLEATESFTVPASGPDLYRCFVIPTNLPRDVMLSAVEYRPGNRRVVHHMMAFIDTDGGGRRRDASDPGPGYSSFSGAGVDVTGDLGGWAAGNAPVRLPEGVGRALPRRSDVILQVHYLPTGKPETDRPKIAFYFSKTAVRQTLQWANATNDAFKLPAGDPNIVVKATWFVPVDVDALGVTPHMHVLGRDFKMSVKFPDGRTQDLIHIDDWDPAWQDTYYFEERVSLPRSSVVTVTAVYDNSSHPRNPNKPPKLVTKGPEASDEMCVGYIGVVKTGQDLTQPGHNDDLHHILSSQFLRAVQRQRSDAQERKRRSR